MAEEYDFNKDFILQSDEKNVWISFNIFDNAFDVYRPQQKCIESEKLEFIPILSYNIFDKEKIDKCRESLIFAKQLFDSNNKKYISKKIFPSNLTSFVLCTNKVLYKFNKYLKLPSGLCIKSIKADSNIKIELERITSFARCTYCNSKGLSCCSRNRNYNFDKNKETINSIEEIKLDSNNQINKFDKYFDKNGLDNSLWTNFIIKEMPELIEHLQESFANALNTTQKIDQSETYNFIFSSIEEKEHMVEIEFYNIIKTYNGVCGYHLSI